MVLTTLKNVMHEAVVLQGAGEWVPGLRREVCRRPPPALPPHDSIQIYSKFTPNLLTTSPQVWVGGLRAHIHVMYKVAVAAESGS